MKAFFPHDGLAEITVQTVRVFHDVAADLVQEAARPWPARTFGDVRVALFPRSQVPVLRPVTVFSVFHSFFSRFWRWRDGERLAP